MPKIPSRARGLGAASSSWISPEELAALLDVMARYDATEVTQTHGTGEGRTRLTVRRGGHGGPGGGAMLSPALATSIAHAAAMPSPAMHHAASPAAAPAPTSEEGIVYVTSPLVGTFYRAPTPDAPIFVDVGTRIRPGQRLCIVEAMKLMNEIESELEGTILEILVENGKPVEYGQKLFKVKKG